MEIAQGIFSFKDMVINGKFAEHASYRGRRYGTAMEDCKKENTVIALTPAGLRSLKRAGIQVFSVYIKVDRRSRLIKILGRGDDIEEAYRRSLSDVGQFDGVRLETDVVISNEKYRIPPEELAEQIRFIYENEGGMTAPCFFCI